MVSNIPSDNITPPVESDFKICKLFCASDAESNDENTGSDMNTDGEKCVLDADTHDDDFPSDARSIMDNGSDTESYDDNYSSDADSNDEDCPTADKDSDNRCGTSEALLDSCSRGPAEKEAIEVLMNCLGKSVRHSPCDKVITKEVRLMVWFLLCYLHASIYSDQKYLNVKLPDEKV